MKCNNDCKKIIKTLGGDDEGHISEIKEKSYKYKYLYTILL